MHNLEDYVWLKVVHIERIRCRTILLMARAQDYNCKYVRVCVFLNSYFLVEWLSYESVSKDQS